MTGRPVIYDDVLYEPGAKFRIVREGAHLSGLTPIRGMSSSYRGWRQDLHVGDVIECAGFGPGWGSDPGYGIGWFSEQAREDHASFVEFYPEVGGAFAYRPAPGFLEPLPPGWQEEKEP